MSGSKDSRTAERIPVANGVKVMVKGRVILAAIAVNISMGGMFINAAAALPVGSPCEVAISLPDGSAGESFLTQGRIVRSGDAGTAIQFASILGDKTLDVIVKPSTFPVDSLVHSLASYYKVSQSRSGAVCEKAFGIPRQTFKLITTATFGASLPAAILPVWLLRGHVLPVPDWAKVLASFIYVALWLFLLQPLMDLALIRVARARSQRHSKI